MQRVYGKLHLFALSTLNCISDSLVKTQIVSTNQFLGLGFCIWIKSLKKLGRSLEEGFEAFVSFEVKTMLLQF